MKRVILALTWCLCASTAIAAPSKNAATVFVKEVEAAVKANKKVLSDGTPSAIRTHNQRYQSLKDKADALFIPAGPSGACSYATNSAVALWSGLRQYSQKPDSLGKTLVQRHNGDYQENLKLCKRSLRKL